MTNPRQDKLLSIIADQGYCSVEELADNLVVSTQTIRRDIKKLSDDNLIIRHHGGASSLSTMVNPDYEVRKVSETDKKNAIAERIVESIPENSTIFMNIGTTVETIANHLVKKKNLLVITNSLRVANVLHLNTDIDVLIPSGKVKAKNGGIFGSDAIEFIRNFRFDYIITSAGSMDIDGTLLEYDLNVTAMTQEAMKLSRNIYVALDSSKFMPRGSIEFGNLSQATVLFTDATPPERLSEVLKQNNVTVEICS